MATITPENLYTITDVVLEIDFSGDGDFVVSTAIECESTEVGIGGGGTQLTELSVLCGDTFALLGANNNVVVTVTALYTDGQTNDLHEDLQAVAPLQNTAVRWSKSGTAGEHRHIVIGALQALNPPALPSSGGVVFEFVITGEYTTETIV